MSYRFKLLLDLSYDSNKAHSYKAHNIKAHKIKAHKFKANFISIYLNK